MRPLVASFSNCLETNMGPQKALWAQLVLDWKSIAGSLASVSKPLKMNIKRPGAPGVLTLGVWGKSAIEVSYQTPDLRARINHYAGFEAVNKISCVAANPPAVAANKKRKPSVILPKDKAWLEDFLQKEKTTCEALEKLLTSFGAALLKKQIL